MKELSPELVQAIERVAAAPILLVASDFDGTLAPLAGTPEAAQADPAALAALRALARMPATHVAVVSGRRYDDLRNRLGDEFRLVGEHGAQWKRGLPLSQEQARLRDRVHSELLEVARAFQGTIVETKNAGVALHYRKTPISLHPQLIRAVDEVALRTGCPMHRAGILVRELSVLGTTKGDALSRLTQRVHAAECLFVGDDATDEDAFAALRPHDVGVKVGNEPTKAGFRVLNVAGVRALLERLAAARGEHLSRTMPAPIDHHALLSDQRTIALVNPAGDIAWMCAPRIDSPSVFASLLGGPSAGHFHVRPADGRPWHSRQYIADSFVLETRYEGVTITDYLDCSGGRAYQRAGRSDLVRVVSGSGRVALEFAPRVDFGRVPTRVRVAPHGLVVEGAPDPLALFSPGVEWTIRQDGNHQSASAEIELTPGKDLLLELRLGSVGLMKPHADEPSRRETTRRFWAGWAQTLRLPPYHAELAKRSGLVFKALCHGPTGAICAAATTSLPEQLGGVRNWDYRFCWIRDAAMSASALVRMGSTGHAMKYLDWLQGVLEDLGTPERLRPIYTVSGAELGQEGEVAEIPGYAMSRPVRVGNSAGQQVQLDVFGVVAELVSLLVEHGGHLAPEHLRTLDAMVAAVAARWKEPDHGIWEVRGPLRHHVHSKAMCWLAVDRAIHTRELLGEPVRQSDLALRDAIRDEVLARGYNEGRRSFVAAFGEDTLDAAVLLIGLTGLVAPDDPRFISTVETVERELCDNGTVYRYLYDDGLPGVEGGFHLCTGWLIESLALVGRVDDARKMLDTYASHAGPLGLYAEERDPRSGLALGNHPQAYSHLALVNAAFRVARIEAEKAATGSPAPDA